MYCTKCGAKATENDRICPKCQAPLGAAHSVSPPGRAAKGAQSGATAGLVYKHEKTLFILHAILSTLFWLVLIVGTLGIALIYVLFFFIAYLFAQSGLISWLKGNGIKLGPDQYPELYDRYVRCCQRLGVSPAPDVYLLNGGGMLNAFATRFLGRNFVVLYSNVVDALAERPEAINFYIGHELGHIHRKHLQWGPFIWPASILPLLGAAYSRAREYTCDQYGRACCDDPQSALMGLATLAAGEKLWSRLSIPAFLEQAKGSGRFWMAFHELLADYPWIVKRAARLDNPNYNPPRRNAFAWLIALFIPRTGLGGGGAGGLIVVAMIAILAAVAVPAYQSYKQRAAMDPFEAMEAMPAQTLPNDPVSEPATPANPAEPAPANTAEAIPAELLTPVEAHLENLRAGDVDTAYNTTSPEFKQSISLEDYKKFVENYPVLADNTAFNALSHTLDGTTAQVIGHLTDGTRNLIKIEFALISLDGNWLVQGLNLSAADQ